jgi:hypothetical protein
VNGPESINSFSGHVPGRFDSAAVNGYVVIVPQWRPEPFSAVDDKESAGNCVLAVLMRIPVERIEIPETVQPSFPVLGPD